jgi:Putative prokaryotic signal transducing protein
VADVSLTVVGNQPEAEMLCGLLRTNGIACWYRTTNLAVGMADASAAIGGPREVFVDENDLEEARKLLPRGS